MKRNFLLIFSLCVLMMASCEKTAMDDAFAGGELKSAKKAMIFKAHLSGNQEVPAVETTATGEAVFLLNKDGDALTFKLIVANIDNVRMAHIHLAPAGVNGGVVVWLYPSAPPFQLIPGTTNGILAEGTITEANFSGALLGQPFSELVSAMSAGNAYVNVHTDAYPGGEIRGQISGN
ncbi:CHRD domain-containing protein [Gaoshiqia sp. Z1-71]|uniref:CHRD domain-containing protein n=1 Tax=Gaoshiqia hydrogeniformans TaxID=3290090 RepID=UPI003BF784C9